MIFRAVARVLGAGMVAAAVAALPQVPGTPVIAGYLMFIAAVIALELVRAAARAQPEGVGSAFERALGRRPARSGRPEELTRLEDRVRLSTVAALDVHRRLRPALQDVASHRLRVRHGIDLENDAGRARALLGEETWTLVRPDARPPADRYAGGLTPAQLGRVLDRIEAL